MAFSLRQKQIDVVVRMLSLNHPVQSGSAADEEVYKILVLDRFCRDIISPLLRVNDLRKHGITVILMIDSDRQNIPDVPAIYFVQPTAGNIQRIVQDATRGVYDAFHLNFSSSLSRPLLEELAAGALKGDCLHRVTKVYDQYLEFVTLEKGMFSLAQPQAYVHLNDPKALDKDVEATIEAIVNGLFCVLATLGVVPIIRCPKGGPAEMVATQLDARLRDHLVSRNNLFTEAGHFGSTFQRPLLCIFDRNFELAVAVQHCWAYRPMVHDILDMRLNRVMVQADVTTTGTTLGNKGKKSYELDDGDSFWVANCDAPFPKVAEEVEVQLNKYKQDVEEVNKKTGPSADDFESEELIGNTKHLMTAVNSLPMLTERKGVIDKHTNIATALLGEIKARGIDNFFSTEEDMLTRGSADKAAVMGVLKGKGTAVDKVRFAVVCLLASEVLPPADVEVMEAVLRETGADLAALHYVKQLKSLNVTLASANTGSRGNLLDWADKLYGQSISAVTAGVKNLLSGGRQLALTRAVEALTEAKPAPETETYLLLDPRGPRGGGIATAGAGARGPFKEAIVFMIGGGNYLEYGSLQEYAQRQQPPKSVMYGATEILSGEQFTLQLGELGAKMAAALGSS
eukprot:SM000001S04689  [mRNA]  locus=s1:1778855:1782556:+ [translate_table: standard]